MERERLIAKFLIADLQTSPLSGLSLMPAAGIEQSFERSI
jgi:hypothetical protein